MSGFSRREFLRRSAATAVALQVPFFVRPDLAGAGRGPGGAPLLLVVFLRGGADGLALLPPLEDPALADTRGALQAKHPHPFPDADFGLHPALAPIAPYAESGHLAAVCAVGLAEVQRSHFEAQDACERAGARAGAHPEGWLSRALAAGDAPATAFRAMAATRGRPLALSGDPRALAFESIEDLRLPGRAGPAHAALATLFETRGPGAAGEIARAGREALAAVRAAELAADSSAGREAGFQGRLGRQLATVAHLARTDLGLVAACVDAGGWDTHLRQGAEEGALARAAAELASGLAALCRTLESRFDDLLVLVVTEFGRTVAPNGSGGTDHGRGSAALALGGAVRGGRVYGRWPGTAPEDREDGRDLRVTTDVRDVLAEGAGHLGARDLETVFPNYVPRATGLLHPV